MQPRLVLASQSPRRAQLLEMLGLSFEVAPADIDEAWITGEEPAAHVDRLARAKADAVAGQFAVAVDDRMIRSAPPADPLSSDVIVVGSDTVVALDGLVLGKPADADDAVRMLLALQGRTHLVATGVAVIAGGTMRSAVESVRVHFRSFDAATAKGYVATGEPLDKAGAYGIQGYGATLVDRIEGDFFAVMGFPIARFLELLGSHGWRYNYRGLERLP